MKIISFLAVCALLGSAFASAGGEADPPFVRLAPFAKAPVIDGRIGPEEWAGAFMGCGIAPLRNGGIDPIPVEYYFTYDRERIYLAARMETRPGEVYNTKPRTLAGGGPSGHFELIVDPTGQHPDQSWVQAMLFPLGDFKNVGYNNRIGGYVPYDIEWDYADHAEGGQWSVELSAPLTAFRDGSLEPGSVWGVLFGGRIEGAMEYFAGSTGTKFNQRQHYTKFILDNEAPLVRVTGLGDLASGKIEPAISVTNKGKTPLRLKTRFVVRDDKTTVSEHAEEAVAAAGGVAKFSRAVPLPDGAALQWLDVITEEGGEVIYHGVYRLGAPRLPVWPAAKAESLAPLLVEAHLYPYFNKVRALADFGGVPAPEKVKRVKFTVTGADGAKLGEAECESFDNRTADMVIDIPGKLAEGEYTLKAEVLDGGGAAVADGSGKFTHKLFGFEHNQIGVGNQVLKPWTPIEVNRGARTIGVWNRSCRLGANGLPEAVESAGKEILAGPIRLQTSGADGEKLLVGEGVTFGTVAPNEVCASAKGAMGDCKVDVAVRGEYDGMLEYEVTIDAPPEAKVGGMELVIPLKDEHAKFIHACGDGVRTNYSRDLPAGEGVVFDSTKVLQFVMPRSWLTYAWLGDHERGLCFWADSAEGWTLPDERSTPTAIVRRKGDVVELVFRIISKETAVRWAGREPRKFRFYLEATPVRPRAPWAGDVGVADTKRTLQRGPTLKWIGWTGWAFVGQEDENFHLKSSQYSFAHLRPINEAATESLKEMAAKVKKSGMKILAYTDMRFRSLIGEMEKAYAREWSPDQTILRDAVINPAPHWTNVLISTTPSRFDYDLWCIENLMDLGIDTWYFDEVQSEGQINPITGLGYKDEEGRWMPTMRLMAYREFWKRLYTLMQQRGQEIPLIVLHNTSTMYAGPFAFCTATWDFEEANPDPEKRHLTKFGMSYLLAQTMGHQYGFVASTLGPGGGFEPWLPEHPEQKSSVERHWVGVHMLLNMNPYLRGDESITGALEILGRFGWNEPDCRWTGYWNISGIIDHKPGNAENVYVSAYERKGRTLLVFLNDNNKPVTVQWKPSAGRKLTSVVDPATQKKYQPDAQGNYSLEMPLHDYRTLVLESGKGAR